MDHKLGENRSLSVICSPFRYKGRATVPGIYQHISTALDQDVLVIHLTVEQVKDYVVAEELRAELVQAVRRATVAKFVLDLQRMTFMTSLACVAFIGLKHAVRDKPGRLVLCNLSDFIQKVFNAKRLLSPSQQTGSVAFEFTDSLSAALQRLAAPPAE